MKKYKLFYTFISLMLLPANLAHAGTLVDNGDGTISDRSTHLVWQKKDDGTNRTWTDANAYCEGLTLAGHADWRLPTQKELRSITDMIISDPAINTTYFPGKQLDYDYYWSSTTRANDTLKAYSVRFSDGDWSRNYKTRSSDDQFNWYVRCVR